MDIKKYTIIHLAQCWNYCNVCMFLCLAIFCENFVTSIRLGGPAHGIVTKNCTQNSARGGGVKGVRVVGVKG